MKRFNFWFIAAGGGILAIALSGLLDHIGSAYNVEVPRFAIFIVALSYAAIPVFFVVAQRSIDIKTVRMVRKIMIAPMLVTALVAVMPLVMSGSAVFQKDWSNLLTSLTAALFLAPFAWYYLSLYRCLGQVLTDASQQAVETTENA